MTLDPDPLYVQVDEPESSTIHERTKRVGTIAAACLLGCALIVLVALGRNGS